MTNTITETITETIAAVARTRLETADGGAKAALESVLRIAADTPPSEFVATLSQALDKAVSLCFHFEPITFAEWWARLREVAGPDVEAVPYDWDFIRALASELGSVLHVATQETELGVHEDWDAPWAWIDDELLEAVAALRSGDDAPLAAWLEREAFTAAMDDQTLLDAAGVSDIGHVLDECTKLVPAVVESVRLRLPEATDGMVAGEITEALVLDAADAAVAAAGSRAAA